jgi:DNA invertase Pin-like site-specific DNA recombinase
LLFSEPLSEKGTANDLGRLRAGGSVGQSLDVQLVEKLKGCDKVFKEKRSGVDTGRPALKQCLEFLRDGDTLLVTKIDRLARSTSELYRIVSELGEKGVNFKVLDDPSIDTRRPS